MRIAILAILAIVHCVTGQDPTTVAPAASGGTAYVDKQSIVCDSNGIRFNFRHDSDLYDETNLEISLYTGVHNNIRVATYVPGSDSVSIDYAHYQIVATTAFGSNGRPLLYNIEQPFYAVPLPQAPDTTRNFTFGVYCTIAAYDNVNVSTNTTDNGHGDHSGDIIVPQDHVEAKLLGVKSDGSSVIGDSLQFVLDLNDNTYASLIPVSCNYYNPEDDSKSMPFVSDSCPRTFPNDPDGSFGMMKQISTQKYELFFHAFTFDDKKPHSYLAIECDVQLCITADIEKCSLPCWGYSPSTTSTTAAPPTTTTPSADTTTTGDTTAAGDTTTAADTTTETTTAETTTATDKPPRRRRFVAKYHSVVKRDTGSATPKTTTITEKAMFKVSTPEDAAAQAAAACSDGGLLSALYAVIGILATLVAVLVCTVIYVMRLRRPVGVKGEY